MINIIINEMNRADVITVEGTVNSETAPQLNSALNEQLDKGHCNLVIDLSQADYMSSAGLRALVAAMKRAHEGGGKLVIAAPSDRVHQVMELGGLSEVFTIFGDQLAAVGSY